MQCMLLFFFARGTFLAARFFADFKQLSRPSVGVPHMAGKRLRAKLCSLFTLSRHAKNMYACMYACMYMYVCMYA